MVGGSIRAPEQPASRESGGADAWRDDGGGEGGGGGGGGGSGADQQREPPEGRLPSPAAPTLSEIFAASPRDAGATGFVLGQLPRGKPLLWVQERMAMLEAGRIYPPGLGQPGLEVFELIHVSAKDARAAFWAMEEGLRCSALGAVIGEIWGDPQALDFTATRRLAVAAERNGVAAYLIRQGGHANLSGARMRWRIASAPSLPHPFDPKAPGAAVWDAELFRARGFAPNRWIVGSDGATDRLDLVAAPRDRTLDQGQRRVG